jgi:hypothetical protein
LYEVSGATEVPIDGIANIQIRFPQQQFFGDICLTATSTAGGDDVESTRPYRVKLARFKLHIHNFHKDTFFKDSFGKYSYIKTIVYLLGSENRLIQDVNAPLQVSLRYEDNLEEEVPTTSSDKPALNLFDLHHRIEKGCSLIPFRIEVVSSSHNNRSFVFYVQPEANGRHNDGSILPCVSTPIEVKARLRPFNPDRTPPKYNPNRYHQEQERIRQSARELLDAGTASIQESLISNQRTPIHTPAAKKSSSPPTNNTDFEIPLHGLTISGSSQQPPLNRQSPKPLSSTTATTSTNPRSPISPIAVKIESGNTQSARSVFRAEHVIADAPVTPKAKSVPIKQEDEDDDEEDWVINFKKNSLVISGLDMDRWEEKILRGASTQSRPTAEDSKPSSVSSPVSSSLRTTPLKK